MNRIKELRTGQNLSLKEVAEAIGIADSQLSFYENGQRKPRNPSVWKDLADYFHVSEAYLRGISNDPKQIDWSKYDESLSKDLLYEVWLYDNGISLDDLIEHGAPIKIDGLGLTATERKALELFVEALKELRK